MIIFYQQSGTLQKEYWQQKPFKIKIDATIITTRKKHCPCSREGPIFQLLSEPLLGYMTIGGMETDAEVQVTTVCVFPLTVMPTPTHYISHARLLPFQIYAQLLSRSIKGLASKLRRVSPLTSPQVEEGDS